MTSQMKFKGDFIWSLSALQEQTFVKMCPFCRKVRFASLNIHMGKVKIHMGKIFQSFDGRNLTQCDQNNKSFMLVSKFCPSRVVSAYQSTDFAKSWIPFDVFSLFLIQLTRFTWQSWTSLRPTFHGSLILLIMWNTIWLIFIIFDMVVLFNIANELITLEGHHDLEILNNIFNTFWQFFFRCGLKG